MSNKKTRNKRNQMLTIKEPGDLVPMSDFQREFLSSHGKYVHNPEMELIIAVDSQKGSKMQFGADPLPWESPLTVQDVKHLEQAKQKKYKCCNSNCNMYSKDSTAEYYTVTHRTTRQQMEDSETKRNICIHVGVKCKQCKQHIKFVKRTMSHRRAAKDQFVSGPHQKIQNIFRS